MYIQDCTNFTKILYPPHYSRHQKGAIKQVPYWGLTTIVTIQNLFTIATWHPWLLRTCALSLSLRKQMLECYSLFQQIFKCKWRTPVYCNKWRIPGNKTWIVYRCVSYHVFMDTTSRLSSTDSYFRRKPTHNNAGTNIVNWFNFVISVIKHLIFLAFYCESSYL